MSDWPTEGFLSPLDCWWTNCLLSLIVGQEEKACGWGKMNNEWHMMNNDHLKPDQCLVSHLCLGSYICAKSRCQNLKKKKKKNQDWKKERRREREVLLTASASTRAVDIILSRLDDENDGDFPRVWGRARTRSSPSKTSCLWMWACAWYDKKRTSMYMLIRL